MAISDAVQSATLVLIIDEKQWGQWKKRIAHKVFPSNDGGIHSTSLLPDYVLLPNGCEVGFFSHTDKTFLVFSGFSDFFKFLCFFWQSFF